MPYSYVNYTGDGTTTTFAVPFPYISQTHVVVTINGTVQTVTWPTAGTIRFAAAPTNLAVILIQRITPISTALVVFSDGGTLTATDLNTVTNQDLYVNQEALDLAASQPGLFKSEVLTVTDPNILSQLTYAANGNFAALSVNGQTFLLNSGAFTISGKTVTWNPSNGWSLSSGWQVSIAYTYNNPLQHA